MNQVSIENLPESKKKKKRRKILLQIKYIKDETKLK